MSCPELTMIGVVRYPIDRLGITRRVSGFWGGQHHGSPRPKARLGGALPAKTHPTPARVTLYPQGRLLGEPKATRALLQFLASTSVGLSQGYLQRAVERARKDEEWGWKHWRRQLEQERGSREGSLS